MRKNFQVSLGATNPTTEKHKKRNGHFKSHVTN